MALGENVGIADSLKAAYGLVRPHWKQFLLPIFMYASVFVLFTIPTVITKLLFCRIRVLINGAVFKFQEFPMPYIAGQSACEKVVSSAPAGVPTQTTGPNHVVYMVSTWIAKSPNCTEHVKVKDVT